ncbi:hypothetical protein MSG28_015509 [Choristoneura fumiferana]|uniref:Uncharacterized protein n=1 Tax=Choristoneura fumiferana TaxID=7141 RepID=A0ACC0KAG7_CHOFU|nr:hypothetical protein MSG28_015509 [Choristoneura fumiferana]
MVRVKFPIRTGPAWELWPKPSCSERRPVPSSGTCGCRRCFETRSVAPAPPPRPRPRVRSRPPAYGVHTYQELAGGKSGSSGVRRSSERERTIGELREKVSTKTSGLNGLRNIGNTCFMNSVIQGLSNTRPLLEYLENDKYLEDINTTLSCMKGALIKAFASVIKELWAPGERDGVVNTTAFKSQVQRFAPRFMGYSQQDAQEFLRYLLEGLHEDVNRVTVKPKPILTEIDDSLSDSAKATEAWSRYLRMEDSHVGDIFIGQLKSTLRCTHCRNDSVTFDPFWDLSLPIPSRTGNLKLQQCLQHFTKEEEMDGDEKPVWLPALLRDPECGASPAAAPAPARAQPAPAYGVHTYQYKFIQYKKRSISCYRSWRGGRVGAVACDVAARESALSGAEREGLNGLRNIGNTCFMNSVIQGLSNTRPLLEYLENDKYLEDINTTLSCMKGALIKELSE